MEPPPVVLAMDVYRRRCVKQIRRVLWSMPGVYRISASRRTGMVVVRGDMRMDAETLQRRLEHYMARPVTVVSEGGRPSQGPSSHFQEIMPYYAPPAAYPHYPAPPPYYSYGQYAGGGPPSTCTIM